jgi:hypothetical protein
MWGQPRFVSHLFFFFRHRVCNSFGGQYVCFSFIFLFYIHPHLRVQCSWFVNMKIWKYTNILQQLNFTYCWNSMEHITLGWQSWRIPDGNCPKCYESENVWLHEHLTNVCLVHSHFLALLRPEMQLDLHCRKLCGIISLAAYILHTVSYFCK